MAVLRGGSLLLLRRMSLTARAFTLCLRLPPQVKKFDDKLLLVAHGVVIAGVDLSKLHSNKRERPVARCRSR